MAELLPEAAEADAAAAKQECARLQARADIEWGAKEVVDRRSDGQLLVRWAPPRPSRTDETTPNVAHSARTSASNCAVISSSGPIKLRSTTVRPPAGAAGSADDEGCAGGHALAPKHASCPAPF